MSRRIQIEDFQAAGGPAPDKYWDRVLKYIPAEVVGAWIAIEGVIAGVSTGPTNVVRWIVFALGVILTPIYIWGQTTDPNRPPAVTQIVISALAFIVWVFALGGPFVGLGFYQPWLGSVLLIVFTLVIGAITPSEG